MRRLRPSALAGREPAASARQGPSPFRPTPAKNRLLAELPAEDLAALAPFLEACSVSRGAGLVADDGGEHVFFPETAILAVFSEGSSEVDLGPIGFEGVAGLSALFGNSPFRFTVSAEGVCLRIPAAFLAETIDHREQVRARLMRYEVQRQAEIAEIARANALCTVEQRLARYLLAYRERSSGDDLDLTHGMLSLMLGVRRAGVTDALHVLEGKGAIRNTRGVVTVRDREMLRRTSRCDSW
jgi:CRP-like cAMP-binding protein